MAPLASLLFAACALLAPLHAATIPDANSELQKIIPAVVPEEIKELPSTNPENEIANLNKPVKQIENELRIKPAEDIPVQVLIDEVAPSMQINEVTDDEDIKRPQADLTNPGPPQRQEHENQNPEQHSDDQLKVSTIKENIEQTQALLKQSFQGVTDDIQNWIANNDEPSKIQQNIKNLRETFTSQIQKLNDTLQALAKPEISKPSELQKTESQRDFKTVESRFKVLADNFYNGVQTLSEGFQIVASLRSASDVDTFAKEEPAEQASASETPTLTQPIQPVPPAQTVAPSPPQNFILQAMSDFYNRTMTNFQNFQNALTPPRPAEVQADQPEGTTQGPFFPILANLRPNVTNSFQQFINSLNNNSFTNIFPTSLTLPPLSNPFMQFWTTTIKPAESPSASVATAEASSSATATSGQDSKPEPQSEKPVTPEASQPAAQSTATETGGPIRQFLNNNPVVQGIAGAVQRIQNTITNQSQDTPREPVQKGIGILGLLDKGKPGKPGGSGDNIGVTGKLSEKAKDAVPEEPKKEPDFNKEVEVEVKPEVISEKTE